MSGGKEGFILSKRPKAYKLLPQQQKFLEVIEACGIRKGITRSELVDKMKNCVPQYYAQMKDENKEGESTDSSPSPA